MENTITVVTEDGTELQAEILDIFNVEEYKDKEYILYTLNEEDGDNVKVYISILEENDEDYSIVRIEDDKEYEIVEKYVREMEEANE